MKKMNMAMATLIASPMLLNGEQVVENNRPNVILCMADDLGWGDVGYNGNNIIRTPHLDKMAGDGVRFDRFYASSPVCSPTRASCLTGRHPYRTGVFFANVGMLRPEEVTMADLLKEQGYATGHFGKWHLGTFTTTEKDANRGGPNGVKQSLITDAPVVTSDYVPTVLDVLDVASPYPLDGESFLPLLEGRAFERQNPIQFVSHDQKAVNDRVYKLYTRGEETELYDLVKDQEEAENLAEALPEVVEKYEALFADWFVDVENSFKGTEYGTAPLERLPQKWRGIRESE